MLFLVSSNNSEPLHVPDEQVYWLIIVLVAYDKIHYYKIIGYSSVILAPFDSQSFNILINL